ncbi:MAG: type II toxin-antitoxin system VapC family toxin [Phreatobacter sp.]
MTTVVETSALVAIILNEPEAPRLLARLALIEPATIPASCYLEASMVLARRAHGRRDLDRLLSGFAVSFTPLDEPIARLAADAFQRFGKSSGHPAQLNFGDCLAYATAMHLDAPLLFKGDDFGHTDVQAAL